MHGIVQANIDRFKSLLSEPTKRATIIRLLAEEEAKLKQIAEPELKQT